jgi:hypothetical protein
MVFRHKKLTFAIIRAYMAILQQNFTVCKKLMNWRETTKAAVFCWRYLRWLYFAYWAKNKVKD